MDQMGPHTRARQLLAVPSRSVYSAVTLAGKADGRYWLRRGPPDTAPEGTRTCCRWHRCVAVACSGLSSDRRYTLWTPLCIRCLLFSNLRPPRLLSITSKLSFSSLFFIF